MNKKGFTSDEDSNRPMESEVNKAISENTHDQLKKNTPCRLSTEIDKNHTENNTAKKSNVSFFDLPPCGYLTINKDNVITNACPTFAGILGVEKSSIINNHFTSLLDDNSLETYKHHLNELIHSQDKLNCELVLIGKDNKKISVMLESKLDGNSENKNIRVKNSLVGIDIPVMEEPPIEKYDRQAMTAWQLTDDLFFLFDKQNKILTLNSSALDFFEIEEENIEGQSIFNVFQTEFAEGICQKIQTVFKSGEPTTWEYKLRDAEKSTLLKSFFNPYKNSEENVSEVICIMKRIPQLNRKELGIAESRFATEESIKVLRKKLSDAYKIINYELDERKKKDIKLKKSEEKFRALFEHLPLGIAISTPEGIIIDANPAIIKMFGYSSKRKFLKINATYLYANPEDRNRFLEILDEGKLDNIEFQYMRRDGTTFFGSELAIKTKGENAEDNFFCGIIDVTMRNETESELKISREHLRALASHLQIIREEERSQIAREIHDEIGHILTIIKNDMEGLLENTLESKDSLHNDINSLISLTDALLDTVRNIASELRPGVLDHLGLIPAIEWQSKQFQMRTQIKCEYEFDENIAIVGDEETTAVFRIFQETLTNITRHAKATHVNVSLRSENSRTKLRVEDNGIGFDLNKLSDIQSLGLIGMNERAISINGILKFESHLGKGTIMTLVF